MIRWWNELSLVHLFRTRTQFHLAFIFFEERRPSGIQADDPEDLFLRDAHGRAGRFDGNRFRRPAQLMEDVVAFEPDHLRFPGPCPG